MTKESSTRPSSTRPSSIRPSSNSFKGKKEIKPGKVVKIEELKRVFKHYDAVKDSGVFNFLKLSAPYYPSLIRIFYSNAEYKVRSIDKLTKEHWIESSIMGKPIKLTNEVLEEILELPQVGIEWYQTDIENKENHNEDIKECKGTSDLGFNDRVLFAIITNGIRHITTLKMQKLVFNDRL